jgi:oligogalacturonide lyase
MNLFSSQKTARSLLLLSCLAAIGTEPALAQIGRRFPSEKKIVPDPVTGIPLTFLTSTPAGDSKIYQTHHQWTSDGKWVIFRSNRARGQAMAVNEETGEMVQVTENGYSGMLCLADHSMNLYFARTPGMVLRDVSGAPATGGAMVSPAEAAANPSETAGAPAPSTGSSPSDTTVAAAANPEPSRAGGASRTPSEIVRVDLAKLFADSAAGTLKAASEYEHVCGTIPVEYGNVGDVALDPTEDFVYFRVSNKEITAQHLPADVKPEKAFGPRGLGAGPTGLASMNLKTGEIKFIVAVPFQIGHVQTNPWVPGEIVFCWETGGKAPQRTWTVKSDGSDLRPVYKEAEYEWITHEAVITKDEVAIALIEMNRNGPDGKPMPRRFPAQVQAQIDGTANSANSSAPQGTAAPNGGQNQNRRPQGDPALWGPAGGAASSEHPTGLGIVNLRTKQMRIIGQVPVGDAGRSVWHVNGSPDGRWAVGDDFQYRLWLIDRHTGEMILLTDNGHKTTAADHQHPTFSADSTRIEFQSAMLSPDGRLMNICVVPVPKSWLSRNYTDKISE